MTDIILDDHTNLTGRQIVLNPDTGDYYYVTPSQALPETGIGGETSEGLVALYHDGQQLCFYHGQPVPIPNLDTLACTNEALDAERREMAVSVDGTEVDRFEYDRFQMINPAMDAEEAEEDHDVCLYLCRLMANDKAMQNLLGLWAKT